MSPLCHRSVFCAKSAQNGQLRKVRFFVQIRSFSAESRVFCPEKPANSSPPSLSPLAFLRIFRGPTARRGPARSPPRWSVSPPRWSVSPPSLSPLTSPLRPAPFLVQKALKTVESEEFVFPCRTASGMPEPQVSLVFGRKQAPDGHFAQDSGKPANSSPPSLSPLVTALSPLRHRSLWGRKVRNAAELHAGSHCQRRIAPLNPVASAGLP